jgi:hypothetical protein
MGQNLCYLMTLFQLQNSELARVSLHCRTHCLNLSALKVEVSVFFQIVNTYVPDRTVLCLRVYDRVLTDV